MRIREFSKLLLVAVLIGCRQDPPTPPPPTSVSKTLPDGVRRADMKIAETAEQPIDPAKGGSVDVTGLAVSIPADAIEAADTLQIQRLTAPSDVYSLIVPVDAYSIKFHKGSKLKRPAVLRFPFDPARLLPHSDLSGVRVVHLEASGKTSFLPVFVDTNKGFVEAQTESFSIVFITGISLLSAAVTTLVDMVQAHKILDEVMANPQTDVQVATAYYAQGGYEWCWAACAAMLLSSYGDQIQPHEIARHYSALKSDGGTLSWLGFLAGEETHVFDIARLHAFYGQAGVPLTFTQWGPGGAAEINIRAFIVAMLRLQRPVWVGLYNYDGKDHGHAIMIVGYNHRGFYIHDPSGALYELLRATRPPDQPRVSLDYLHLSWSEWEGLFAHSYPVIGPLRSNLAAAWEPVPANGRRVTMQLMSGPGGVVFQRNGAPLDLGHHSVRLHWNGKVEGGIGFSTAEVRNDAELGTEGLSNSDSLQKLIPVVHNTGMETFEGYLEAELDGCPIRETIPVRVLPRAIKQETPMVLNSRIDGAFQAFTKPQDRVAMPLRDALNFSAWPLEPGDHELRVYLRTHDRKVADGVRIPFKMRPSVPAGVKAVKKTLLDGKVIHVVTWSAVPEESIRKNGELTYMIYRKVKNGGPVPYRYVYGSGHEEEVPIETPPDAPLAYGLAVKDNRTGLESPVSMLSDPPLDGKAGAVPPPPPPPPPPPGAAALELQGGERINERLWRGSISFKNLNPFPKLEPHVAEFGEAPDQKSFRALLRVDVDGLTSYTVFRWNGMFPNGSDVRILMPRPGTFNAKVTLYLGGPSEKPIERTIPITLRDADEPAPIEEKRRQQYQQDVARYEALEQKAYAAWMQKPDDSYALHQWIGAYDQLHLGKLLLRGWPYYVKYGQAELQDMDRKLRPLKGDWSRLESRIGSLATLRFRCTMYRGDVKGAEDVLEEAARALERIPENTRISWIQSFGPVMCVTELIDVLLETKLDADRARALAERWRALYPKFSPSSLKKIDDWTPFIARIRRFFPPEAFRD